MGAGGLESLNFSATRSDSTVVASLGASTLFGKGTIYGVRRSFIMDLRTGVFQLLTLGADYKDLDDTTDTAGVLDKTPIKYLPLSASWLGVFSDGPDEWQLGSTLAGGLRGLVNKQTEFDNKRDQASASYGLLRLDARLDRKLPWLGLRLRAALETQWTRDPLISNEQFVLGGADSVRGYREAEGVGDIGLRSALQLSTPDLAPRLGWTRLGSLSAHVFIEGAVAHLLEPLPEQLHRTRLLGTGIGAQLGLKGLVPLNLSLDLAWPLLKRGDLGGEGLRLHANASIGF
jgi:hemolysin activation/secretion protein